MKVVANYLLEPLQDMLNVLAQEEAKKAPEVVLTSPPPAKPITYLGDVGSSTVDLVGEPAFKNIMLGKQPS